ncbi:MAG TPA: tripartite tricarboxylate transporter substrate binding protein [Bordetella sp.]|nr:tripartite tricarboxylate transporter substrate binding protein [Bordetella sp.]
MKGFRFLIRMRAGAVAAAAVLGMYSGAVQAAGFPEKGRTITLIVPYGAGGMVDALGRTLASYWDAKWGTSTVVLNRPGANGQLAFGEMFRRAPDGYTIAFTQAFDTQMSYLDARANAPYSRSSFIPVGLVQRTPSAWMVRADSPYRSIQELLDAGKQGDGIDLGSPSSRGPAILYAKAVDDTFGARLNLVPFNDVPSTINALLGGHIDVAISNAAVALPHIKAGKLRALMIGGTKPLKYFPGVPPASAIGLPLPDFSNTGMALPRGTPPAAVQAWSAMLKEISDDPGLRAKMDAIGINLDYTTPEQYEQLWAINDQDVTAVLMALFGQARPVQ